MEWLSRGKQEKDSNDVRDYQVIRAQTLPEGERVPGSTRPKQQVLRLSTGMSSERIKKRWQINQK